MTTETLTNRKIEAARNVLRQVACGLPFGMAFPFDRHRPKQRDGFPQRWRWPGLTVWASLPPAPPKLNQNGQPRQRTIWLFRAWDRGYDQHALLSHCIADFARPTMPDDLSRQIEACKSRIASVRSLIRAMQAAGETSSEAERQLAREVAFLRTLEDIRSEKELDAEAEAAADDAPGVRTMLLH
jgi:hypothetical protein